MGNLQSGEVKVPKTGKSPGKVKSLMKIRGKRGKQEEPQFTSIVQPPPPDEPDRMSYVSARDLTPRSEEPPPLFTPPRSRKPPPKPETDNTTARMPPQMTPNSSSDSAFTDAQTPVGFATELNRYCYHSEESVSLDVEVPDATHSGNFLLNNFKLNEHRVRKDGGLDTKLSKLGVSRTSQISLEGCGGQGFASENVECVVQKNVAVVGHRRADEDGEGAKKPTDLNLPQGELLEFDDCFYRRR